MKTHFIKWGVAPLVAMIATGLHRLGIVDRPATVLFTAATPRDLMSRHAALNRHESKPTPWVSGFTSFATKHLATLIPRGAGHSMTPLRA